jgi:pyruvate/2-oxoglutarate dehydrogenase complex dihydrolipoamide acyltransferase (E2) component
MKRSTLLALPLLTVMSWSSARAEDVAAPKSLIGLRCKDEAAKFCADAQPGGGKLAHCLRGHDADLAEPCKTALASGWRGKRSEAAAAPAAPAAAPVPAAAAPTPAAPAGEAAPAAEAKAKEKGKDKKEHHHGKGPKAEGAKADAPKDAAKPAAKTEAPKAEAKPAAAAPAK